MKKHEIQAYAEVMQKWGLTRLSITGDGISLTLERPVPEASPAGQEAAVRKKGEKKKEARADEAAPAASVTSPMVGVFYAAPAENEEPFVRVGDRVRAGQTLCIIEAMKLMNEIRAESDCEILDICVTNGQVVEYGTELFRIRE